MARYGMVIDLKRCIGCNACVVACKSEHNTPAGIFQTSVLEKELGKFPYTNRVFLPVLCNHCEQPTCADVCPTKAIASSAKINAKGYVIPVEKDMDSCKVCGLCELMCPDFAIAIEENNSG